MDLHGGLHASSVIKTVPYFTRDGAMSKRSRRVLRLHLHQGRLSADKGALRLPYWVRWWQLGRSSLQRNQL